MITINNSGKDYFQTNPKGEWQYGKSYSYRSNIVLVIVGVLAATEAVTNEHDKRVEAFGVFVACCIILCVVMIFGVIGCF